MKNNGFQRGDTPLYLPFAQYYRRFYSTSGRVLITGLVILALSTWADVVLADNDHQITPNPIIIGGEYDYPPYSQLDRDGRPSGFNSELTREIAKKMGLTIEIKLGPWTEIRKALENGKITAIQGMYYSEERAKTFEFSPPFATINHVVFGRKDTAVIKSVDELRNKELLVMQDDIMHDYVVSNHLSKRTLLARTPADVLRMLASGKGDYALVAQLPGLYWIKELKLSNLRIAGPVLLPSNYCYAVRKGNTILLSQLTEGLNIVKISGEYRKLYKKWLGILEETKIDGQLVSRYILFALLPLTALLIGFYLWTRTLRRMVSQKTKELQASRENFKQLIEQSPLATVVASLRENNKIEMLNRRFIEMFGYTAKDLPDLEHWWPLAYPDPAYRAEVRKKWSARVKDVIADHGSIEPMTAIVTCKDGSQRHIEFHNSSIGENSLTTFIDITERKKVEEILARTAREWSAAMDASDDIIYLLDLERRLVRANKPFYVVTETTPETAIGKHIAELIHPDGEPSPCPVCRAQEDKQDLVIVMEPDDPDNPFNRPIEIIVKIIRDNKQQPISILMTLHDLTSTRKEMEEKVVLERQLHRAQRLESVGRLAGGVAHDFNNMLGVIIGHAEIALRQIDQDQPVYSALTEIYKAARRSADLTRQLLAFARKQTVAPKVLDLNETVEGMLKMLRRLIGEDVNLTWQPGANLWPIKMDTSQIDQILANLCVNARDAISGVGKVNITTENRIIDEGYSSIHPDTVPGQYVLLTVSDTGCGMDRDTIQHIFEPFFSSKDMNEGTGLGLSTVYGIIKQNEGFINVYSEPGLGTIFKIYLPRHMGRFGQEINDEKIEPPERGQGTILLVEDEDTVRDITTLMLEGLGYRVFSAGNSDDALELARKHNGKIDLLMTDVIMPKMNGRDLAERIRTIQPELKSLFISGYTSDIISRHGILDENVRFIQKPFSTTDLASKVKQVLQEH